MIVDDEVSLANLLKNTLQVQGYQVLCVSDGDSALQQAKDFKPDLILLDIMMPRMSGLDTIDIFRNTLETSTAIIFVYSALSDPKNIEKAKSLGANDYIVKSNMPFEEVVGKITGALNDTVKTA